MRNNFDQTFLNTLLRLKRDTKIFNKYDIVQFPFIQIGDEVKIIFSLELDTWVINRNDQIVDYSTSPSTFYKLLMEFETVVINKAISDYNSFTKSIYIKMDATPLKNKFIEYINLQKLYSNYGIQFQVELNNSDQISVWFNGENHIYTINNNNLLMLTETDIQIIIGNSNWYNISFALNNLWKNLKTRK